MLPDMVTGMLACTGLHPIGKCLQAPDFYAPVPPAPPGLEWWHYRGDVPPLPQPADFFHSKKYKNWGAYKLVSSVSQVDLGWPEDYVGCLQQQCSWLKEQCEEGLL